MVSIFCEKLLLPEGWAENAAIHINDDGIIIEVKKDASPKDCTENAGGIVLAGMPNVHSHAFQYAMAGMAEHARDEEDSFWTWREVMYHFVNRLKPEQMQAIAAQLYVDMLKGGYTSVAEFHYLHHDRDGGHYGDIAELSHRVIAAAKEAGIGITHLPVLYAYSHFGGKPPLDTQRRFVNNTQSFRRLVETLRDTYRQDKDVKVGLAYHSLRAVSADMVAEFSGLAKGGAVHIHVAEQEKEVQDCLAAYGKRPVEWLMENCEVDGSWCLIHATHMTEEEIQAVTKTGAVAGLCPTTEANLGDGIFALKPFIQAEGKWAVGSDSHISISSLSELRMLEYSQRLKHQRRNIAVHAAGGSVGRFLYDTALRAGAQALGICAGAIEEDARADLVVLDGDTPALYGKQDNNILDAAIFAERSMNPVKHVMSGGQWVVRDGAHDKQEAIQESYQRVMRELTSDL